eukprot:g60763.t1
MFNTNIGATSGGLYIKFGNSIAALNSPYAGTEFYVPLGLLGASQAVDGRWDQTPTALAGFQYISPYLLGYVQVLCYTPWTQVCQSGNASLCQVCAQGHALSFAVKMGNRLAATQPVTVSLNYAQTALAQNRQVSLLPTSQWETEWWTPVYKTRCRLHGSYGDGLFLYDLLGVTGKDQSNSGSGHCDGNQVCSQPCLALMQKSSDFNEDWAAEMIPLSRLTKQAMVALAWGRQPSNYATCMFLTTTACTGPAPDSGVTSTLWIASTTNGTVHADRNVDLIPDDSQYLAPRQVWQYGLGTQTDLSGTCIYTQNAANVMVVWGQSVAGGDLDLATVGPPGLESRNHLNGSVSTYTVADAPGFPLAGAGLASKEMLPAERHLVVWNGTWSCKAVRLSPLQLNSTTSNCPLQGNVLSALTDDYVKESYVLHAVTGASGTVQVKHFSARNLAGKYIMSSTGQASPAPAGTLPGAAVFMPTIVTTFGDALSFVAYPDGNWTISDACNISFNIKVNITVCPKSAYDGNHLCAIVPIDVIQSFASTSPAPSNSITRSSSPSTSITRSTTPSATVTGSSSLTASTSNSPRSGSVSSTPSSSLTASSPAAGSSNSNRNSGGSTSSNSITRSSSPSASIRSTSPSATVTGSSSLTASTSNSPRSGSVSPTPSSSLTASSPAAGSSNSNSNSGGSTSSNSITPSSSPSASIRSTTLSATVTGSSSLTASTSNSPRSGSVSSTPSLTASSPAAGSSSSNSNSGGSTSSPAVSSSPAATAATSSRAPPAAASPSESPTDVSSPKATSSPNTGASVSPMRSPGDPCAQFTTCVTCLQNNEEKVDRLACTIMASDISCVWCTSNGPKRCVSAPAHAGNQNITFSLAEGNKAIIDHYKSGNSDNALEAVCSGSNVVKLCAVSNLAPIVQAEWRMLPLLAGLCALAIVLRD